jgi:hypothetical protein
MTHLTFDGAQAVDPRRREYDRLIWPAALCGLSLLLALGGWLLVRRWAGAFERPLDSAGLGVAALLLVLWSGGLRWAWSRMAAHGGFRPSWVRHLFGILTTAGVFAFGVALSVPGSPPATLAAFWCVLLATETAWGIVVFARRGDGAALAADCGAAPPVADDAPRTEVDSARWSLPDTGEFENDTDELLAADESQRISRCRDPRGGETISGLVRCAFAAGERQRDVHLAFCPPLQRTPHFSLEQIEGPAARIRTSLVETFGVGLEVKLTSLSSEPTSVQIQFFACEESMDDAPH